MASFSHRAALRFDGLFWRRLARFGCVHGPEWWKRYAPPWVALAIFLIVGRNRRSTVENQRRVLGPGATSLQVHRAAFAVFRAFARCLTESLEFYGHRALPFRIDEPDRNHITEALEKGQGAILVTAHVGNWEIPARALQRRGRPVNMVMAREPNATAQEFAIASRKQEGVEIILSDSSVFSAFNMIKALRGNSIVAIQIDRGAPNPLAPRGTRLVPFFGEDAPFQEGPFHLARISGSPVIPVFTLRRGLRHYEIRLGTPRYVARSVTGDTMAALGETVAQLEAIIREKPEQWFQFTPFWPAAQPHAAEPAQPEAPRPPESPADEDRLHLADPL